MFVRGFPSVLAVSCDHAGTFAGSGLSGEIFPPRVSSSARRCSACLPPRFGGDSLIFPLFFFLPPLPFLFLTFSLFKISFILFILFISFSPPVYVLPVRVREGEYFAQRSQGIGVVLNFAGAAAMEGQRGDLGYPRDAP